MRLGRAGPVASGAAAGSKGSAGAAGRACWGVHAAEILGAKKGSYRLSSYYTHTWRSPDHLTGPWPTPIGTQMMAGARAAHIHRSSAHRVPLRAFSGVLHCSAADVAPVSRSSHGAATALRNAAESEQRTPTPGPHRPARAPGWRPGEGGVGQVRTVRAGRLYVLDCGRCAAAALASIDLLFISLRCLAGAASRAHMSSGAATHRCLRVARPAAGYSAAPAYATARNEDCGVLDPSPPSDRLDRASAAHTRTAGGAERPPAADVQQRPVKRQLRGAHARVTPDRPLRPAGPAARPRRGAAHRRCRRSQGEAGARPPAHHAEVAVPWSGVGPTHTEVAQPHHGEGSEAQPG